MKLVISIILAFLSLSLSAQDKKADKILENLSEKYDNTTSLSIEFDLIIAYPEQEVVTLPSTVIQSEDMWVFKNDEQELYNDGKDIWMYIPGRNEVQINDYDGEEAEDYFVSPLGIINQYQSGLYKYQIVDKDKSSTNLEFVPKDEFSDYSKFGILVNTKTNEITQIKAFGKDGSKATLIITKIEMNLEIEDSIFTFDKAKHPGVRIEDLRLD